ncbi:MAG: glycosyltransferase family 4 protein [Chloroflexi bacterium]|nr:glycosyltransferase family 4 protein [Chloroflexota bacterium]
MQAEDQQISGQRTGQTLRIGINAHLLSSQSGYRRAGIHQYIAQVLINLPQVGGRFDYLVYTRHDDSFLQRTGVTAVSTPLPTERRLVRIAWEQLRWPWLARRHQLDLLHSMAFVTPLLSSRPSVVTAYDLSFLHSPESFPAMQRLYLTTMTRRSCKRARRVITISQSGRQDVHQFFNIPLQKIDVIVPGVDRMYQPCDPVTVAAFKEEQGINGRFILHVGTLQPRKNIPLLIEAFAKLNDPNLKLVLVGGKGWLYDSIFAQVQQLGLQDQVIFTGYVPDESLPLWYSAADLFVFPSLYEGCGMPVIEAMACGTPVVASNRSSIPEAGGEAGHLFDPTNVNDCAERMANVLNDPEISGKMRQLGLNYAKQFSWERAGRETAVVYKKALQHYE